MEARSSRAAATSSAVSFSPWIRPTTSWTFASKSCTPIEIRLKPSFASVSICDRVVMAGSISTAFSTSFVKSKWRREDLVAAGELLLVEEGGRAAAPVELATLAPVRQLRRDERDLLLEQVEVGVGARAVVRRDDVAAAEPAHLPAEREVDVDRERAALGVGAGEVLLVLAGPERRP